MCGVVGAIKRELRRRSAMEPIIGHMKAEGQRPRWRPAHVILSAVGHNFRRVLAWLRELLRLFLFQLSRALACPAPLNRVS
jgi:transposase, IS5 family